MWSYFYSVGQSIFAVRVREMGPLRFELRFRRIPRTFKYVPNAEGWSRLPYGPLLIWCQCIYKLYMGQEHTTATVACDSQVIHDLGRIFAVFCSPFVFIPAARDYFSTTETTDWYHLCMPYLYDFWYLARAPGPPNFLVSFCLESFTRRLRSYAI